MSLPNPITRKEEYLNAIATSGTDYPVKPITREEAYLDAIAKNSGGGGSVVTITPAGNSGQKIADYTIDSTEGALYVDAPTTADMLYKADNSVIAPTENGSTASQAYAEGAHFIKGGAFCTASSAIASGDTLTENTNYTAGDVASALSSGGGGGEVYPAEGTEVKIGTWAGYDLYRQMFRKTSTYKNTDVSMGVLPLGYYIVAVQGYYKDDTIGNGHISALPQYASVNDSLKTARVNTFDNIKYENIEIEVMNGFLGAGLDYIVIVDYLKSAPTS